MNQDFEKLSKTIVNYSLGVKEKEKVCISIPNEKCIPFVECLIKDIYAVKALPFVEFKNTKLNAKLLKYTGDERIKVLKKQEEFYVDMYDCFINIRYTENDFEEKIVPITVRKNLGEALKKSHDIKINKRRWVLLNYPSSLDAYKASLPEDEFFKYAFDVMNVDYCAMEQKIEPLKKLMEKTDKVRIKGKDTDITFSIKGMPIRPCCGKYNIPDGEIYTAPIKTSVNGKITFNTPSFYQGNVYHNISLTFENGKIVKCSCLEDNEQLEEIFNTDEGSRYVGEFSFGLNPLIKNPIGDILYDEKIIGSIHFTPGSAYKDAYNGNDSSIHWDLVLIQTKEYGGGEIYFDDVLIRKDGLFVIDELKHLNYDLK